MLKDEMDKLQENMKYYVDLRRHSEGADLSKLIVQAEAQAKDIRKLVNQKER